MWIKLQMPLETKLSPNVFHFTILLTHEFLCDFPFKNLWNHKRINNWDNILPQCEGFLFSQWRLGLNRMQIFFTPYDSSVSQSVLCTQQLFELFIHLFLARKNDFKGANYAKQVVSLNHPHFFFFSSNLQQLSYIHFT